MANVNGLKGFDGNRHPCCSDQHLISHALLLGTGGPVVYVLALLRMTEDVFVVACRMPTELCCEKFPLVMKQAGNI